MTPLWVWEEWEQPSLDAANHFYAYGVQQAKDWPPQWYLAGAQNTNPQNQMNIIGRPSLFGGGMFSLFGF